MPTAFAFHLLVLVAVAVAVLRLPLPTPPPCRRRRCSLRSLPYSTAVPLYYPPRREEKEDRMTTDDDDHLHDVHAEYEPKGWQERRVYQCRQAAT